MRVLCLCSSRRFFADAGRAGRTWGADIVEEGTRLLCPGSFHGDASDLPVKMPLFRNLRNPAHFLCFIPEDGDGVKAACGRNSACSEVERSQMISMEMESVKAEYVYSRVCR